MEAITLQEVRHRLLAAAGWPNLDENADDRTIVNRLLCSRWVYPNKAPAGKPKLDHVVLPLAPVVDSWFRSTIT
jgi:hypothetical protein